MIVRASSRDNPNVDGAIRNELKKYKDVRGFKSIEEWKFRFPFEFHEKVISTGYTKEGRPYRIIDGSNKTIWTIEIKDLIEFINKYGEIVIIPPREEYVDFEDLYTVIIYDDYLE